MTHLSLFTGVGGFDLGFDLAGFETVAQVEADAHCRTVLAHHWPEVPRYDDIRRIHGNRAYSWRGLHWRNSGIDVITGGFPCQDLSVAGKRAGLAGARSGLFVSLARVVEEVRPRLLVWENVPGLLSSDERKAMAQVIRQLGVLGYRGAYRVLDSQFAGVPQRRRRVFGAFAPGSAGGWACGAAVLLEPEGGGGHPAAGGQAGEGAPGEPAACLNSGGNAGGFRTEPGEHLIEDFVPDVVGTLSPGAHPGGFNGQDAYCGQLVANTLRAADGHHGHSSPRGDGADNLVAFTQNQRDEVRLCGGDGDQVGALSADRGMKQQSYIAGAGVRRLTPLECERLQGFPDGWTDVQGMSDTQRYRQLGNAVTVLVAYWIALRARMVLQQAGGE